MHYRLLPRARADLDGIADYISQDNPHAALRMHARFIATFESLSAQPRMGVELLDIKKGLRYFPVKPYLIFYQIDDEVLSIVRVLHSAREWQELLLVE